MKLDALYPNIGALVLASFFLYACGAKKMDPNTAWSMMESPTVVIDVRTMEEVTSGHLEGALNIPYEDIVEGVASLGLAKDAPIAVYCRSGNRSGIAQSMLQAEGYTQVVNAGAYVDLASANPNGAVNAHLSR